MLSKRATATPPHSFNYTKGSLKPSSSFSKPTLYFAIAASISLGTNLGIKMCDPAPNVIPKVDAPSAR